MLPMRLPPCFIGGMYQFRANVDNGKELSCLLSINRSEMENIVRKEKKNEAISDEKLDRLLKESLVELPKQTEEAMQRTLQAQDETARPELSEERVQFLRERIQFEQMREKTEQEEKEKRIRERRMRRWKMAGSCVIIAIVIAMLPPMVGRTSKKDVTTFFGTEEPWEIRFGDDDVGVIYDEEGFWEVVFDTYGAPRIVYDGLNNLVFSKGSFSEYSGVIDIFYQYSGTIISVKIMRLSEEEKKDYRRNGSLLEELILKDGKTNVKIYSSLNTSGQEFYFAEFLYRQWRYTISSSLELEELMRVIQSISFIEETD